MKLEKKQLKEDINTQNIDGEIIHPVYRSKYDGWIYDSDLAIIMVKAAEGNDSESSDDIHKAKKKEAFLFNNAFAKACSGKTIGEAREYLRKELSKYAITDDLKEDIEEYIEDRLETELYNEFESRLWDEMKKEKVNDDEWDMLTDEFDKIEWCDVDAYKKLIARVKDVKANREQAPEGYEEFEGYLNDQDQPLGVGAEVITRDGEHYWITFVDNWDDKYAWGSPNKSDIETEQGYSIDKDDIRFVKPHAYNESLKEDYISGENGLDMWQDDYMMNADSYSKEYKDNFLKIQKLKKEIKTAFNNCKTVKEANDCYEESVDKVSDLADEIYKAFGGRGKTPVGISDTLDYFEDAIGDFEDKALTRIERETSKDESLKEGTDMSNKNLVDEIEERDIVVVVMDDEIEDYKYTNDYQADAHFAELSDMSNDELRKRGIKGFARLQGDFDFSEGRWCWTITDHYVVDDDYSPTFVDTVEEYVGTLPTWSWGDEEDIDESLKEGENMNKKSLVNESEETIKVPNDAWEYIDKIINKYFGKGEGWEEKINKEVEDLFNRHKGDSVWEKARKMWHDAGSDIEESLKERKNANKKLTEAVDKNALVKFIDDALEDLKSSDAYHTAVPVWYFDMSSPNGLHLVIGYDSADNYDSDDLERLALDKSGEFVVNAKLAVNVDDLQSDFDWDWYMPFDRKTGEVWDTEMAITKYETPEDIAKEYLDEFEKMKDLNIDEDGAIIDEPVEEACEKKPMKESVEDDLYVMYWMDEDRRDQGIADYFYDIEDIEDGKDVVDKLIDLEDYACAELLNGEDVVLYGRDAEDTWGELDESCKKSIKEAKDPARDLMIGIVKDVVNANAEVDMDADTITMSGNDLDHIAEEIADMFVNEHHDFDLDESCKKEEKCEECDKKPLKESGENKGEMIAKIIAKALEGECGAFGGEDPMIDGNRVGLHSQAPTEWYTFNSDGSVDVEFGKPIEDEADYDETVHFNTVEDLLKSDLLWFFDIPNKDLILNDVNAILKDDTMTEKCDKKADKKSLKENFYGDTVKVIQDVLDMHDNDMVDLIYDLVDRALDIAKYNGDVWDACMQAVDEGMIYTEDQWRAYKYYCDMGDDKDIMWESLIEDVFRVTSEMLENGANDPDPELEGGDDHDDEGADDPMTGDDVWESLKLFDEEPLTEAKDKRLVKDVLDVELEDDDTETGGTSFAHETLEDFLFSIQDSDEDADVMNCIIDGKKVADTTLDEINKMLKDCGIKPIK